MKVTSESMQCHSIAFIIVFMFAFGISDLFAAPSETVTERTSSSLFDDSAVAMAADSLFPYVEHQDKVFTLAGEFADKGLPFDELLTDSRFELYENIGRTFKGSAEKKSPNIDEYKQILGYQAKLGNIVQFIEKYEEELQRAEEEYDIPKYVIAAILGVESDFGRTTGTYNPFNAYVSMYAVGHREKFAKAQLEELLIFARERGVDVLDLKSSYAGAMSYAQFIPYSLNKWFVGDDLLDMENNIMSVGNYLAYFMERTNSLEKAVFRYNPSSLYTQAVLDLAREAEEAVATLR